MSTIAKRILGRLKRILCRVIGILAYPLERYIMTKYADLPLRHQPVFIIGAPRTGSTILYQTITNNFDVLYINNLSATLHRCLATAFLLSRAIFGNRPHNNYTSYYGLTKGSNAPSECGEFWYRVMGKHVHYLDEEDVTDDMVEAVRTEVTALTNLFDKPFLFNNNNAALRIKLIARAFPDAKWIIAERNPYDVAVSLLKAREVLCGSVEEWWSMKPKEYEDIKRKACPEEQVVLQHYYISKCIKEDIEEYSAADNVMYVEYADFVSDPFVLIDHISAKFSIEKRQPNFQSPFIKQVDLNIKNSNTKIYEILEDLDWHDYSSAP